MITSILQAAGAVAGIVGAVFVAGQSRHSRRIGFATWIVSNSCWIVSGILTRNPFLVVMFGFYFLTAVIGVVNNDRPEGSL
jgi:membrane associated rhomboid family serine protease